MRRASRPKRRRSCDANPDLQFLTVPELEAVVPAIPDEVVVRQPAPTRRGRAGSAPPIPPDVLGPVIRVVVLTAAMTGLRQSEISACAGVTSTGPRSASVCATRGSAASHSGEGKSELSTRRSVPMADRLARELNRCSRRTLYGADDDLVFAHPAVGRPLDRSKLTGGSTRRAPTRAWVS